MKFKMPDMSQFAQPRYQDIPRNLLDRILGAMDISFPTCPCRRKFILDWQNRGLEFAYALWKRSFDDPTQYQDTVRNHRYLPQLEEAINAVRALGAK